MPSDSNVARRAEKVLIDDKPEVRAAAAATLGDMQSRASITKLRVVMDDQGSMTRP
jgi:HEAT repeat protein